MRFVSGFSLFLLITWLNFDVVIYNINRFMKYKDGRPGRGLWKKFKLLLRKIGKTIGVVLFYIYVIPPAVYAFFMKCREISITLKEFDSNDLNVLYNKDPFETMKGIITLIGFMINIAYLNNLPGMNWWLEVHRIEKHIFYDLLLKEKGTWITIKVIFEYSNALQLNKIFWKSLRRG
ncbi:15670_t:CDS:1 [Funneliformis geosporum]|uniref:5977_t:CDS:1 n=1 Tax=Funneliformis geosporum TaxID=1117311 RepID=A0A9W4SS27_9GLOM|nr:15670_t:CDS:1 [Funneliformis geosporum]CAI2178491.1 5977_t:CDS:1 [Funneliformis geosporum]